MVFTVLRAGDGEKLFRRFARDARFLVEHPNVAECLLQQYLGHRAERMEGGQPANGRRIDLRHGIVDFLAPVPQFSIENDANGHCNVQEFFAGGNFLLHSAGAFRRRKFIPAQRRSLSRMEIFRCTLQELFAHGNFLLHSAGAFRAWKFPPAQCRSFSHTEILPRSVQQVFDKNLKEKQYKRTKNGKN